MKKTISLFVSAMAAFLIAFGMVACGDKLPDPENVAAKIDAGQTLSEDDYASMIDYCGKYAKEAQKYYDLINAQPNDSTAEAIRATSDLATLYGNYRYLDLFRTTLASTDLNKLGASNEKKVNEYAEYQGFPLPLGDSANINDPNVVGMIEDMPSTDSTGVIANGDGEAVNINVH